MTGEIQPPFDWATGDFIDDDSANVASPSPYAWPYRSGMRKIEQYAAVALAAFAMVEYGLPWITGRDHHGTPAAVACNDNPSTRDLAAVTRLFAHDGVPQAYGPTVAKDYGLHLSANNEQLDSFNDGTWSSTQDEITSANEALSPYGIDVQVGLPLIVSSSTGFENPTPADLKQNLSSALEDITEPLMNLPTEVTKLSGIRQIILMEGPDSDSQVGLYAPGIFIWNINNDSTANLMDETVYQGIDDSECGDTSTSDPAYASFNGRPPLSIYNPAVAQEYGLLSLDNFGDPQQGDSYSIDPESTLVYNNPRGRVAYNKGTQTGNYQAFCILLRHNFESIVVATQAGFEGPEEDKIGIGGLLLDVDSGNNGFLFNVDSPDLRSKALFLAARLYKQSLELLIIWLVQAFDQHPRMIRVRMFQIINVGRLTRITV